MADTVMEELQMAEISLAKVPDVSELKKEAAKLVEDIRTDISIKDRVEKALIVINEKADYEITPQLVQKTDDMINEFGGLKVKAGGRITVDGMESFGLTVTPKEWRASRVAGLESFLADTYRNIKRLANQLSDTFERRYTELTTSLEVLDTRIENVTSMLDSVTQQRDGKKQVELNGLLVRALTKGNEAFPSDLAKHIVKEVNYFSSVMKLCEMELSRYRGNIIRYFGNSKLKELNNVTFSAPKILNFNGKVDPKEENVFLRSESAPMLEGRVVSCKFVAPRWLKDHYTGESENDVYSELLAETGFELRAVNRRDSGSVNVNTMTLSQMFTILKVVQELVEYIRNLNNEYNSLDLNPEEIKDNLVTLKRGDDEGKVRQYALLTTDYDYKVNLFRADVSNYLTVLSSHLLTLLTVHLECYDVQ